MKFLVLLFAIAFTTQSQAMTYDDGCGPTQYLCQNECIPQELECPAPAPTSSQVLMLRFDQSAPKSRCSPECGPDQYCAPFFGGHYACFNN